MQNFLFDFDGTLINSAPGLMQSVIDVAAKNKLPYKTEDEIMPHLGLAEFHVFRDLYGVAAEEEAEISEQMSLRYAELADQLQRPFAGIPDWLQMLKDDGATLIVCSARQPQNSAPLLERMGLLSYFDDVWGNDEGSGRNTKAKVIEYELNKAKMDPLQTVMVGDKDFDCIAAKANGLFMLGCSYGYGSPQELFDYKSDLIISNVTQGQQATRILRRM
ncbi:MAG: HAD family hydrolase [Christensenellales bacterium]